MVHGIYAGLRSPKPEGIIAVGVETESLLEAGGGTLLILAR